MLRLLEIAYAVSCSCPQTPEYAGKLWYETVLLVPQRA